MSVGANTLSTPLLTLWDCLRVVPSRWLGPKHGDVRGGALARPTGICAPFSVCPQNTRLRHGHKNVTTKRILEPPPPPPPTESDLICKKFSCNGDVKKKRVTKIEAGAKEYVKDERRSRDQATVKVASNTSGSSRNISSNRACMPGILIFCMITSNSASSRSNFSFSSCFA